MGLQDVFIFRKVVLHMKRFLLLLLALICTLPAASADGPRPLDARYADMSVQEIAACMESAMDAADLPGAVVCCGADGTPIVVMNEYDALCVARRSDGLLTLCSFIPKDGEISLCWHNDLLLSYYQELSLTTEGAAWSGGVLPEMTLQVETLEMSLPLRENAILRIICDGFYGDWVVMELGAYAVDAQGGRLPLLVIDTCSAYDTRILLKYCHPDNWFEAEEASW